MIDQIRRIGWLAVEAGLLLIALCIILSIILGKENAGWVSAVSENAQQFLNTLPPGVVVGVAVLVLIYRYMSTSVR